MSRRIRRNAAELRPLLDRPARPGEHLGEMACACCGGPMQIFAVSEEERIRRMKLMQPDTDAVCPRCSFVDTRHEGCILGPAPNWEATYGRQLGREVADYQRSRETTPPLRTKRAARRRARAK